MVMMLMVIVVLVVTNLVVLVVKVGVVLVTPACCTPHLELTEVWGMSNRENIGFTSLGTTSFTTTPDPLVQLRELWRGFSSPPPPCTALPPPTNTNPH